MTTLFNRRKFLRMLGVGAGAVAITACQPAAAPAPASDPTQAAPAASGPEALVLPVVKDKLTLSYWVGMNQNVGATRKSFGEMTCYQELEKVTNIHLEFQHPAIGQENEQFNLMVTSGKYPDIIEHYLTGAPGGPAKYLRDGVIIRLNELIDQYAPNLKKALDEHPEWRRQILTDEGDIYGFPFLRTDPYLLVFQGPIIRKDWLDKVGLPVPESIDDWKAMLMAFKNDDPNGNGEADEWAFSPMLYGQPLDGFRAPGAFVGAWGVNMAFYNDGGTVKYGPIQPEFKEFLKTMAEWYAEGLIDPDYIAMDQKMMDAKVTGGTLGSFVQNTGGGIGKFLGLMKDDPSFQLVAAPYPVLNKGDKPVFGQRDFNFNGNVTCITTANKNVKETVKMLDYAYSDAGHLLFNFGVEGLTYTMVDGYPKYTDLIMNNPDGLPMQQSMGAHFRSNFAGPFLQDRRYMEQYANLPVQQESLEVWSQPTCEKNMPPVTPTQDESKKFATIMTDVRTRLDEGFNKILTGQQSIDTWDQVVSDIKSLGIEEAVGIQQAALERYNARP